MSDNDFPSSDAIRKAKGQRLVFSKDRKTLKRCANKNITEVVIPDSVTEIGWSTFYLSDGLKTVTLGKGIKEIGGSAFKSCPALTTVKYRGSEADRAKIKIGSENAPLTGAKWEYNVTARASAIVPGFEFVTAQRIMEMNPGEAEPTMSVQLCGYSNEAGNEGSKCTSPYSTLN
jgi:hypothetical protein